jgi:peptide/nickel transport system permease protein
MKRFQIAFVIFCVLNGAILCAGFFAPYPPEQQNRALPFAPPTKIHWRGQAGRFHLRPFVYAISANSDDGSYSEDRGVEYPIRFFISGRAENKGGSGFHLFGVQEPGRVFLFGTDEFGRDVFSRILYGGRISVAAGLLAMLIALGLGTLLGSIAGMAGGIVDSAIMRLAELGLALSWFYLLLAIRAFLPLRTPPLEMFFLVAAVLGLTGWARPARLVRGVLLSAKERGFVMTARGFGAGPVYIFRRHLLPQLLPLIWTQAVILIPQFIMAEVALSFLGLGATEPLASWGNLLAELQSYHVITSYWWMFTPVVVLVLVSFSYFLLMNSLQKRGQSVAV